MIVLLLIKQKKHGKEKKTNIEHEKLK